MRQKFLYLIPIRQLFTGLALLMILVIAFGVNGYLLFELNVRGSAEAAKNREFGIWAVFQLDREITTTTSMFQVEVAEENSYSLKEIYTKYELLYSRIDTLSRGEYRLSFQADESLAKNFFAIHNLVIDYMSVVEQWYDHQRIDRDELIAVADELVTLRNTSLDLLVATNRALSVLQTAEADEIRSRIFWSTTCLSFTFALILFFVWYLFRILKQLGMSNRAAQEAAKAAEAGDRAKSSFLATMSHEIRTPLNGLLGMIDVLDGSNLSPEQQRQLSVAQRSGSALLHIITDILDMSKLDAGAVELETAPFQLRELIQSTTDLVTPEVTQKGLSLTTDFDDVCINTDQARLRQVLFNLMGNAVKFTAYGSVTLSAKLQLAAGTRGFIRFEVTDTGIGISEEGKTHLFKEFSQVDGSISRKYGGTGLGLAISQRLVNIMGGAIGVDSKPGEGSTFWFTVPVEVVASADLAEDVAPAPRSAVSRLGIRILLVEDNDTNRDVALAMLGQIGVVVDVATDGNVAISMASASAYDLIFMDMQMPNMDGLEATRVLRSMGICLPIIGLTGNASVDDRHACLGAGMDDYMSKPVTRAKLREMLDRWSPTQPSSNVDAQCTEIDTAHQAFLRQELGDELFLRSLDDFIVSATAILDRLPLNEDPGAVQVELKSLRSLAKGIGYKGYARLVRSVELGFAQSGSMDIAMLQRQLSSQKAAA